MGGKTEVVKDVAHLVVVVALVQTHTLRFRLGRFGSVYDDPHKGRARQFHIMSIGSVDFYGNGTP